MYYGHATEDPGNALRSEPLRIAEMETVDPAFALQAVSAQPATFLELISAQLNTPNAPLQIVSQRTIDGYASSAPNQPRMIAVSGTNFRTHPDPGAGSYTATLRYYQKLATPAGAAANAILAGTPTSISTAAWSRPRSSPRTSPARCATCALQRLRLGPQRAHAAHRRLVGAGDPPARGNGAMTVIPFAEWRPDMPDLSQWAREALNVVPAEESYRPLNSLSGVSSALSARAQGAAWFRGNDGTTRMFAGDGTRLYMLSSATWNDVTRLGGTKAITAITRANPGQVSVTAHGLSTGDTVFVAGVVGMTQINNLRFGVTVVDADHFTIGVDTTGYSTYGSGGTIQKALVYAPGGDGTWRFAQFGPLAIAVNGVDAPQKFDLSAGTAWDGAGRLAAGRQLHHDGPRLRADGQDRQHAAARAVVGHQQRRACGARCRPTRPTSRTCPTAATSPAWSAARSAWSSRRPAVRRMTYEGPPIMFRIDKIANDAGLQRAGQRRGPARHGVLPAQVAASTWCGRPADHADRPRQGRPHLLDASSTRPTSSAAPSAIDPVRGLYVFAYPANGSSGTPNRLLIYNWRTEPVVARHLRLRAGVRRRQPAGLHARGARRLRHPGDAALLARIRRTGPARCRCCCSASTPAIAAARSPARRWRRPPKPPNSTRATARASVVRAAGR